MTAEIHYLSNGIPVLLDEVLHTKRVAMGVYVMSGSRHESDAKAGAFHLLEHMAFKGTPTRSARDIMLDVEKRGAEINAGTSKEITEYDVIGFGDDAPHFAEVLGDIVCRSTLPEDELARERDGPVAEEIKMLNDDPMDAVNERAMRLAFPGQSFGRPTIGSAGTVAALSRTDLQAVVADHYHAGNIVVSISGRFDKKEVLRTLESNLGLLPKKQTPAFQPAIYGGGRSGHVQKDMEQTHILAIFNAYARGDKNYLPAQLAADCLGNGMSSRLFEEVREKEGLAYAVVADNSGGLDAGLLHVYAATSPDKVKRAAGVIGSVLKDVRNQGLTEDELAKAKQKMRVGLSGTEDSIAARMQGLAHYWIYRDRQILDFDKMTSDLVSVTLDQVNSVLREMLSSNPVVVTTGPGRNPQAYKALTAAMKP